MKSKLLLGIIMTVFVFGFIASVNAIPLWKEYRLGNEMCLYEPINQKTSIRNPIPFEEAWYNNPVPCKNIAIKEVNLEDSTLDIITGNYCNTGEIKTANGCSILERPGRTITLGLNVPVRADYDNNIWSGKQEQKFYRCAWEYADGTKVPKKAITIK